MADIGSGTGILSRLLIGHIKTLYSIEPNDEMRVAAELSLKKQGNYISVNASAEKTSLPDNKLDFITVSQAFHWFNKKAALTEFRRILKKAGKLILIWNNRINNTPFLEGYEKPLLKYGIDYTAINHQNLTDQKIEKYFVHDYKKAVFDNFQKLDFEGFIGRVFSSSYTPAPGDPDYNQLKGGLEELFRRYNVDGYIRFNYNTEIYTGNI